MWIVEGTSIVFLISAEDFIFPFLSFLCRSSAR